MTQCLECNSTPYYSSSDLIVWREGKSLPRLIIATLPGMHTGDRLSPG